LGVVQNLAVHFVPNQIQLDNRLLPSNVTLLHLSITKLRAAEVREAKMKEFIEQLKQYKEFIVIIVAIVSGIFFVLNYFATKEALDQTERKLDQMQVERNCRLDKRVAVAEASAAIAALEREQIEKMSEKIELEKKSAASKSSVDRQVAEMRLQKITIGITQLERDLDRHRNVRTIATDMLVKNACTLSEAAARPKEKS
jgi:hypothetical protein